MLVRAGFRMLIDAQDDIEVVGEAADGAAAARSTPGVGPRPAADVVLMDVRMPAMDGVEATARITAPTATTRRPEVLVLTTFDLDEYVFAALRAGASGFLLKDARPEELLARDPQRSPPATPWWRPARPAGCWTTSCRAAARRRRGRRTRGWPLLTAREREVLLEVAAGASNTEIGARALHGGGDGEDPHRAAAGQARTSGTGSGWCVRVRDRAGRDRGSVDRPHRESDPVDQGDCRARCGADDPAP